MRSNLTRGIYILALLVFTTVSCNLLAPKSNTIPPALSPDASIQVPAQANQPEATSAPQAGIVNMPTQEPAAEPAEERAPLQLQIPAPAGNAVEAASRLAAELAKASSAEEAVSTVGEILTWAGVAIYDSEGKLIQPPKEPASELRLFDFQVYSLALDFTNHGGVSLDDLGQALGETETTVNGVLISPDMLMYLLSEWTVGVAELDPDSWEAFTPAFLHAVNLVKFIGLDLHYAGYEPKDLVLSNLEVTLFAAAHVRSGDPVPNTLGLLGKGGHLASPVQQENACARVQAIFETMFGGDAFGKWISGGINWGMGEALGAGWEAAAEKVGGAVEKAAKFAGKGFGWLMTAVSGLLSMTAWEFNIKADPNPVHYKHDESGDVKGEFVATVKVNETFPRWISDCLKTVGQELPQNDSLQDNMIRWVAIRNIPPHGEFEVNGENSRLEEHFSSSGEARITVKMWQEKDEAWKTAPEKHDHLTVRGELYRKNGMPGVDTLIGALTRNVAGAVTPVLQGWWDKWFPMKTWGRMDVDFHKIVPMTFLLKGNSGGVEWTFRGYNCEGLYGPWTIKYFGIGHPDGMTYTMDGDFEGSTAPDAEMMVSGSLDIALTVPNAPVAATINAAADGLMYIRGTKDNPVLVMEFNEVQGTGTGVAPGAKIQVPLQGPKGSPLGVALHQDPDYPACRNR